MSAQVDPEMAVTTFGPLELYVRRPAIVGFSGLAGAGKSTAADVLIREYGFVRVRFAGPLKAMMAALYAEAGLDADDIVQRIDGGMKEAPDPVLGGTSPRRAMQTLGAEWGRDLIARDLWISLWSRAAAMHSRVVVDDVRFDNEAAAIRALGGMVIRVDCPWAGTSFGHQSEAGVTADAAILNAVMGDTGPLARAVCALAESMIGGG